MKKTATFLFFVSICLMADAQLITVEGFRSPTVYEHGDSFSVTIVNTGTVPATFYVPDADPARATITRGDSSLIDHLVQLAQAQPTQSLKKRAAAQELLHIYKSYRFVNQANPWNAFLGQDPMDSHRKLYAPMGVLHGQPSRKCGNQARSFLEMLLMTGIFNEDELRSVFISNLHEVAEVKIDADFEVFDVDPAMPVGNIKASAAALAADPHNILDTVPQWRDDTWDEVMPAQTMAEYVALWSQPVTVEPFTLVGGRPYEISGEITLCAGCSLVLEHKVPLILDLTTPEGVMLDSMKRALDPTSPMSLNTFVQFCANYWNISEQEVLAKMANGNQKVVKKTGHRYLVWPDVNPVTTITVKTPVPVSPGDVAFPGICLNTSDKVYFPDATLSGEYVFWDYNQALVVNSNNIQYCSNFSSVSPVTIVASCNYRIYDIINGFLIDQLDQLDTLTITRTKNGSMVTSIETVSWQNQDADWVLYPNPSSGFVKIGNLKEQKTLTVTDLTGRLITAIPKGVDSFTLPSGGLYVVSDGVIVQKIIIH